MYFQGFAWHCFIIQRRQDARYRNDARIHTKDVSLVLILGGWIAGKDQKKY